MNQITIGVIGFGRFGRLMTRYLALDFPVRVYNRSDKSEEIEKAGALPADLETVCKQDIVILSTPISGMQEMLQKMAGLLKKGTVVADVCSVKMFPVQWMLETLPRDTAILATHPMFGPDSAAVSLKDRKIVLCPERIPPDRYQCIKSWLAAKQLKLIETTPEEHDRQIAVSLSLTHFIGRSLSEFKAGALEIDTEGYKRLLHILGVVEHDTWQLFMDMHQYNPYALEKRADFMAAMGRIHEKLKKMRVAFQGIRGAYSELALFRHFGPQVESMGYETFDEVFQAVERGDAEYGFIPVENTIAGTVVENYDLLLSNDMFVTTEVYMKISHTLLAPRGTALKDIRTVWSHPHALKQCRDFLKKHGIRPVPRYDTAGAARMVSEERPPGCAAIASELCAEIYDLDVLHRDIQTNQTNTTRFFVMVKQGNRPPALRHYEKTTIAFKTKHYPGALVDCLRIFQKSNLNLTKLESRPLPENPWEYVFYTDFEGGFDSDTVIRALDELKAHALFVKVLGSYPLGK